MTAENVPGSTGW